MDDNILFIPNIDENEYIQKSKQDYLILNERKKEADELEKNYISVAGRDSRLLDVAEILQTLFPLFIHAYKCIIDEELSDLSIYLKEINAYIEANYNERCSVYAVYVWDIWIIEMYFNNKNIDDLTTYIEQSIASIYLFSKNTYKLNIENNLLSNTDMANLTSTINS